MSIRISAVRDFRLPGAPVGFIVINAPAYYAVWQIHEPDIIRVRDPAGAGIDRLTLLVGGGLVAPGASDIVVQPVTMVTKQKSVENWGGSGAERDDYALHFQDASGACAHAIRFYDDRIEYQLTAEAPGRVRRVVMGLGADGRRSSFHARQLFNAGPMSHGLYHHHPARPQQIRADWLTPPPFAYAFEAADGTWTAAALEDPPGSMPYSHFSTLPDAAGNLAFEIGYRSEPAFDSSFSSPCLTFRFGAPDEMAAIRQHADGMVTAARIPPVMRHQASWWRGVMACGWHQQIHRAADAFNGDAGAACTQEVYEAWIRELEAAGIEPDIITIDMFWGAEHGIWQVDSAKWPDLRGFIDAQHARQRRVLLWICTNTFGLPDEELYMVGDRKLLDPLNEAWRARLDDACQQMFGDGPDDLHADGLKFDFTDIMPFAGVPSRCTRELHGLDYLYELFAAVTAAAKAVRADLLLDYQVAHPAFANLYDMTRLNDYFLPADQALRVMGWRSRIAKAVGCGALVDTDGPVGEAWFRACHRLGNPSLYIDSRHLADHDLVSAVRDGITAFRHQLATEQETPR